MLKSTKTEMGNNDGGGSQRVEGDNGLLRRSGVSVQIQEYLPEGRERPSGPSNTLKCHFLGWPIHPKGKALLSIICWDALLNELCVRKHHQAVSKLVHNHHSLELWDPSNLHHWTMVSITIRYQKNKQNNVFWDIPTHLGSGSQWPLDLGICRWGTPVNFLGFGPDCCPEEPVGFQPAIPGISDISWFCSQLKIHGDN